VQDVFLLGETARQGRAPLAALDESLGRHLLMFNVRGDHNGRHHAPDWPMLDTITGLGWLAGAAALLRRRWEWRGLFLFAGLGIGMLPSVLSVDSPHAMRSIGAVAFACLIAALGWVELGRLLGHRPGAGVFALALALNAWTYFVVMPTTPEVWLADYPIHTQIGTYLRDSADDRGPQALSQIFIPKGLQDNSVFQYLTYGLPVQWFDGARLSEPAAPGALFVLSGYTYGQDLPLLAPYLGATPRPAGNGPELPDGSNPSFIIYHVP
jgi:hypothetical protein